MSQNPPPDYQPPFGSNYAYPARPDDPRRPARRAAVLMWVIGCLGLLFAGMTVMVAWLMTPEFVATLPNAAQLRRQMDELQAQVNMPWDMIRRTMFFGALFMAIPALLFIVLGFFARTGRRTPVIVSLITSILAAAFLAFQGIGGAATGAAGAGQGVCFTLVAVGLLILLCNWLWQALKAAPLVEAMRHAAAALPTAYPWPAPPTHAHVPTYAPPGQQPPAYGPYAPVPQPGVFSSAGTVSSYTGVMQPPVPPPGYPPSSGAPAGRPVVYGYAQAPHEAPPAQANPPAASDPAQNVNSPAPTAQQPDASNGTST